MVLHNICIWYKVYTFTCSAFINVWHNALSSYNRYQIPDIRYQTRYISQQNTRCARLQLQAPICSKQLEDARAKGAAILTGGVVERYIGGSWMNATLVTGVTHDMLLMKGMDVM